MKDQPKFRALDVVRRKAETTVFPELIEPFVVAHIQRNENAAGGYMYSQNGEDWVAEDYLEKTVTDMKGKSLAEVISFYERQKKEHREAYWSLRATAPNHPAVQLHKERYERFHELVKMLRRVDRLK